jgi:hypothetical protein
MIWCVEKAQRTLRGIFRGKPLASFYIFMTYVVVFSHLIVKLQREVMSHAPTLVVFTWRIAMVSVFPAWTFLP